MVQALENSVRSRIGREQVLGGQQVRERDAAESSAETPEKLPPVDDPRIVGPKDQRHLLRGAGMMAGRTVHGSNQPKTWLAGKPGSECPVQKNPVRLRDEVIVASRTGCRMAAADLLPGDFEDSGGSADFVSHHEQRLAVRTVFLINENQRFRTQIARVRSELGRNVGRGWGQGKVSVVQVADESVLMRIGHIAYHDATDALQTDERPLPSESLAQNEAFGLRPAVVATGVAGVVGIVGVEILRADRRGGLLELIATVED